MKTNKGFSLVELIVVIAIMAIIAAVAIPVYSVYVDKTNKAADEQLVADIQDAITYALASDTSDTYKVTGSEMLAAIILTDAGITVQDAKGGTLFADTLAETFGADYATKLMLKSEDWDASNISNAGAVADSNFFAGDTTEKVDNILSTIQGLTNALGMAMDNSNIAENIGGSAYSQYLDKHGITITGSNTTEVSNTAAFFVSEQISGLSDEQKQEIVDIWKTNEFYISGPGDMISMYGNSRTGLSSMCSLSVFYANAYAMVQYVNDPGFTEVFLDGTSGLSGASDMDTAWGAMGATLEEMNAYVPTDISRDELNAKISAYGAACGETDAKAFIATLEQANDVSGNFTDDFSQENLYASDAMNDYIGGYVDSLKGIANLNVSIPAGAESSYVITVIKNAEGKVTFVPYC